MLAASATASPRTTSARAGAKESCGTGTGALRTAKSSSPLCAPRTKPASVRRGDARRVEGGADLCAEEVGRLDREQVRFPRGGELGGAGGERHLRAGPRAEGGVELRVVETAPCEGRLREGRGVSH